MRNGSRVTRWYTIPTRYEYDIDREIKKRITIRIKLMHY